MATRRTLVVVPSDPIEAYERAGYGGWLERYFNPTGMFDEVFALSPLEQGERYQYGMKIIGVPEREFVRTVRKIGPQLIRAYGGYWPSDLVCRNRVGRIPVIVSVHDTYRPYLHDSIRYADLVIGVSRAVVDELLAAGTDAQRIRNLPNRVDPEIFKPITDVDTLKSLERQFPSSKRILHVGRKVPQKNPDTLIRALELLPSEYVCFFAGLGDIDEYRKLAESLGVAERCIWLGAITNSELPNWYSWCDCMCTPSRWEGFGIVFIEAAACGAAIVTSDIAPMNEYLTDDKSACLVKEFENPIVLAQAIRKSCEDSDYRSKIKAGALEMSRQFSTSLVDELEAVIYREAMTMEPITLSRRLDIAAWKVRTGLDLRIKSVKSRLHSVRE